MNVFCSNCGIELAADANFCFKCGTSTGNGIHNVKAVSTALDMDRGVQFDLLNKKLFFGKDIVDFNELDSKFKENSREHFNSFCEFYINEVHELDDLNNAVIFNILSRIESTIRMGVSTLMDYGVEHYSISDLINIAVEYMELSDDLELIFNGLAEIKEIVDKLIDYRYMERVNRSSWQGGGFGLRGAIGGALLAGALNIGTDTFRSIGDALTDSSDKKKIQKMMKAFLEDPKVMYCGAEATYNSTYAVMEAVFDILVEEGILKDIDLNDDKISTIVNNRVRKYIEEEKFMDKEFYNKTLESVFLGIQTNPYNLEYYKVLYMIVEKKTPQFMKELYTICKYFSIDRELRGIIRAENNKIVKQLSTIPENTIDEIEYKIKVIEETISEYQIPGLDTITIIKDLEENKFLKEHLEVVNEKKGDIESFLKKRKVDKVWDAVRSNSVYAEYVIENYYLTSVCGVYYKNNNIKGIIEIKEYIENKYSDMGIYKDYLILSIVYKWCKIHAEQAEEIENVQKSILELAEKGCISAMVKSMDIELDNDENALIGEKLRELLKFGHPRVFKLLSEGYKFAKFGLPKNEEKAEFLHQIYVKYIGEEEAKYQEILESNQKDNKSVSNDSSCFITTAVCQSFGKEDECYELMSFRKFRDEWLMNEPDGPALITLYYEVAPKIVERIDSRENKDLIYREIWDKYLKKCLDAIECNNLVLCKNIYVEMVRTLSKEYIGSNVSN